MDLMSMQVLVCLKWLTREQHLGQYLMSTITLLSLLLLSLIDCVIALIVVNVH